MLDARDLVHDMTIIVNLLKQEMALSSQILIILYKIHLWNYIQRIIKFKKSVGYKYTICGKIVFNEFLIQINVINLFVFTIKIAQLLKL